MPYAAPGEGSLSADMRAVPHWLTVKIGREDPLSRAMFFLDSDSELAMVLDKLLALAPQPVA